MRLGRRISQDIEIIFLSMPAYEMSVAEPPPVAAYKPTARPEANSWLTPHILKMLL